MSPAHEPSVAHIAVVEDNEADVYLLRIILQRAQGACVIDHLADGDEAVAFLLQLGRHQHAPQSYRGAGDHNDFGFVTDKEIKGGRLGCEGFFLILLSFIPCYSLSRFHPFLFFC